MKTSVAAAVDSSRSQMAWWRRGFRSLGAASGLFAIGVGAAASSVAAQDTDYRSAASAPAAWQEFARQLQVRLAQRLADDGKDARSLLEYMAKRETPDAKPAELRVRAWILPDGRIDRLEFDGLADDGLARNLRTVLMRGDVGAPPPDMLQPLRLRLALRPNQPPAGGK